MAVTNVYCDVAALREQLGDATAQRLPVAILERAINAASREVDKWCGRRFWKDSVVSARTYRARDPYELWTHDIADLTGLVVKTGRSGANWATTWAAADVEAEAVPGYEGDAAQAWARLSGADGGAQVFPTESRTHNVQVTAKWGWSGVPVDVEQATVIRAAAIFNRKDSVHGVAGFGDFGPVRITRRDVDVVALLSGFIRVRNPDL